MQIQGIHQEVQLHGVTQQATGFSIAMNAKAFRVLSSNIYQNKIGSIVRELSANALDAHKMAGCPDKPFYMHLPDQFEPYFVVKDYGTGINPANIESVFTVYFNSTKDQSNDTIGAFGLGSKTPFAYTDQFTVTNIFDGFKYIYSAFVGSNGQPSIVLLSEPIATEEHNGLEINMSVKSEDYATFATEAMDQLKFLTVKPEVENAPSIFTFEHFMQSAEVIAESPGFILVKTTLHPVWLVQGQIGYPLDINQLPLGVAREFLIKLNSFGAIRMDFPIGSIGVTASREAVEYSKETVDAIVQHITDAKTVLQTSYMNKQKAVATNWELACNANQLDMFSLGSDFTLLFKPGQIPPFFRYSQWQFNLPAGCLVSSKQYYGKKQDGANALVAKSNSRIYYIQEDCKYKTLRTKEVLGSVKATEEFVAVVKLPDNVTPAELKAALGGAEIINLNTINVVRNNIPRASYKRTSLWQCNALANIKDWYKVQDATLEETIDTCAAANLDCFVIAVGPRLSLDLKGNEIINKFYMLTQAIECKYNNVYAVREKDYEDALELGARPIEEYIDELQEKAKGIALRRARTQYLRGACGAAMEIKHFLVNNQLDKEAVSIEIQKYIRIAEKLLGGWRNHSLSVKNEYYLDRLFPDANLGWKTFCTDFKRNLQNTLNKYPLFKIDRYALRSLSPAELKALLQVKIG